MRNLSHLPLTPACSAIVLFGLLLMLLMSGCSREETPPTIMLTVEEPFAEQQVAAAEPAKQVAAPSPEPPIPSEVAILARAEGNIHLAFLAWVEERQADGNTAMTSAVETLGLLHHHGWTGDDMEEAFIGLSMRAFLLYAQNPIATQRINDGMDAYRAALAAKDEAN